MAASDEDHPQMKGDYTLVHRLVELLLDEDHPQMKGDYTPIALGTARRQDEDHPQMKGDYTLQRRREARGATKITPK